MPKVLLCLFLNLTALLCVAQKNFGIDQDYYIYQKSGNSIVPLIFYQTKNNLYVSVKYNYEEDKTLSLQFGKTFSKDGRISYSITLLAGVLAGNFNGISIGMTAEAGIGKFSLYTEPEYCRNFKNTKQNFFYNWAELSFDATQFFYTGIALQTVQTKEGILSEPGFVLGFAIKNFEIPLYFFRSKEYSSYLVVGLHWSLGE